MADTQRQSPGEWFLGFLGAHDSAAELPLPEWRRRLNVFCEAWIFAFVVAFFIRHFCVELNRIPSASMEPMLYGDPGFTKGDFVIVDRLTSRFRELKRWNVAVFHYPPPEVESGHGERARPAINLDGQRIDDPFSQPLLCSNFVKRCVVMPGDVFYISGGDIYLKQPDGSFAIAAKPAELQERLWQDVYLAGLQPGYQPWQAEAGGRIVADGPADGLAAEGGVVRFTQPLRNLYVKDGAVLVREMSEMIPWLQAGQPEGGKPGGEVIQDLSMTRPVFRWPRDGSNGNIWDLDRWHLSRLTSADQDDPNRKGRPLNDLMNEWVGDVRIVGEVRHATGSPHLRIAAMNPGTGEPVQAYDLVLNDSGWRIEGVGAAAALHGDGSGSLVGHRIAFAHIDGLVTLAVDGVEVMRQPVPAVDSNQYHPQLSIRGGALTLAGLGVSRDLHYTRKGFLEPNRDAANEDGVAAEIRDRIRADAETQDSIYNGRVRLPRLVRAEILGKSPDDLTRAEAGSAYGTSAVNAITAPQGAYLFLGDNSPFSLDGREWGWVPAENLRGRAWLVIWPWNRWRVVR